VQLYRDLDSLPERFHDGAVAIGNFDGVHQGHARIAQRLLAMAGELGSAALVFTFDPQPARLLHPQRAPAPLCWTERKAELLGQLGVDAVLAYPTDAALLGLEAGEFFERIVLGRLHARGLVEGRNFFFGHDRRGTVELLGQFCRSAGVKLEVVEPLELDGRIVSSSLVRKLVAGGEVAEARRLLGRPYRIRGGVVRGAGRGRDLGFPTANLGGIDTLLPGEGIYAGGVRLDDGPHALALSVGPNPTFQEHALKVEAHVLDFAGDLYDRSLEVDFLARLRDIKRFAAAAELVRQMADDVGSVRRIFAQDYP
jgi:riboflavin kinase/FMN adenylyltransferase